MKDLPDNKRLIVNDLLFADYKCPLNENRFDMWTHHNYFVFVISGKKKWFSGNAEVLAQAGDCIFVKKGAHSIYQYFDDDFCSLFMYLPDDFIRETLLQNELEMQDGNKGHTLLPILRVQTDERLTAYFYSFLSYISKSSPTASEIKLAELKFRELIMIVASGSGNSAITGYFQEVCNNSKPSLRVVMDSNFNYPLSLEEYARLSGRSLSAFKRDFREIYTTTPGRWLTQKRLEHGRYLMENTRKSVTEVMLDCGFKNSSHFSRAFKKQFGKTPLQLRKTSK